MKLHQLQALVSAVEQGSIRAAARHMHLSQAALTKSLRLLEEECGVALLLRKSRGVVLTDAGLRLHARAGLITRQITLAQDDLRHERDQGVVTVRAGITPYLMMTVLGEAFHWFRKRYPRAQLRLHEGLVTGALPKLRDGSLDFAIVADSGDVSSSEFASTTLRQEAQKFVVRSGHPLLDKPNATDLVGLEWVLPGPYVETLSEGLVAMFTKAGISPPTQITRCDAMAAMALVRQSDAVTVMPAPLLALPECQNLAAMQVPGISPPDIDLILLSPPDVPLTPAATYLARCLTDAVMADARGALSAHA